MKTDKKMTRNVHAEGMNCINFFSVGLQHSRKRTLTSEGFDGNVIQKSAGERATSFVMHPFHRASFFGLFLVVGSIQSMAFADDAKDRPREVNLKALLDDPERPPTNGVQLKTPKAEIVERVVGHGLRVHWEIHYSGKRWPLVIQTPDLDGPTYGATKLTLYAQGKSGKNFSWTWESPADPTGNARLAKEAFATVDKKARKVDDDIEVDIQPAKQAFLKYFPKEFDEKVPPVMYARLEHWPTDRGVHVDLDAWTGPLIGAVTKVAIKEW